MTEMVYLKSSMLSASINLQGAELTTLNNHTRGDAYMWSGDAAIWSGIAPVLFPIIGELKDGTYRAKEAEYPLQHHGFARKSVFSITSQTTDQVELSLVSTSQSQANYPWKFRLKISFALTDRSLRVSYRVTNKDDDVMFFNLGSHPAFRLPGVQSGETSISDYAIVFNQRESLDSYALADNLLLPQSNILTPEQGQIRLSPTIFDNDALIFLNLKSDRISLVRLCDDDKGISRRISIETGGAPHLGIWAKPAAPYVCIEPWWGHADFNTASGELSDKASIQTLEPGARFDHSLLISPH